MEKILKLISEGKIEEALTLLRSTQDIKSEDLTNNKNEYNENDRTIRNTQVGNIQKDKTVGTGDKRRIVKPVRIPIPFQKKIVKTATAFEVGAPVSIIPSEENALSDEILRLFRVDRLDDKINKMVSLKKSELQCALLFTIKDLSPNNIFNTILGTNNKKEIKSRILKNDNGNMYPYFDSMGDMIAFTWDFTTINEKGDKVDNSWVYDEKFIYRFSNSSGKFILDQKVAHGFSKIPIVYIKQDKVEWEDAKIMIDRLEVAISKLGDSNDYTGHPILKLYGDVKGAPEKDESGKAFVLEQKVTKDGKTLSADVDFLTYDQAPEAVALEIENLEKYIYSLTSTPDISFDSIKGLGNISGVALRLMFLDSIVKASSNEGENRTMIERIINVLISGNLTTTNTKLKSLATNTIFDVKFNSIIPNDIDTLVKTLQIGVNSKFISQETAIEQLGLVDSTEDEISRINTVKTDLTTE